MFSKSKSYTNLFLLLHQKSSITIDVKDDIPPLLPTQMYPLDEFDEEDLDDFNEEEKTKKVVDEEQNDIESSDSSFIPEIPSNLTSLNLTIRIIKKIKAKK